MPATATETPGGGNPALIGGIVGGVAALLLLRQQGAATMIRCNQMKYRQILFLIALCLLFSFEDLLKTSTRPNFRSASRQTARSPENDFSAFSIGFTLQRDFIIHHILPLATNCHSASEQTRQRGRESMIGTDVKKQLRAPRGAAAPTTRVAQQLALVPFPLAPLCPHCACERCTTQRRWQ